MYYPEEVVEELGPTEILPCTQYWMNDSAPEQLYPTGGRTVGQGLMNIDGDSARDAARAAVLKDLGWPAETSPTRLVVPAGSIGITHFGESGNGPHCFAQRALPFLAVHRRPHGGGRCRQMFSTVERGVPWLPAPAPSG